MGKSFKEVIEEYYAEKKRRDDIESRKEHTAALERLARVLEETQSSNTPEDVQSVSFSDKDKLYFYEVLSPYIPKESLDLLFGNLKTIKCRELKRVWFDKYFNGKIAMKTFFNLCAAVVPERKGEHGWNYNNFK